MGNKRTTISKFKLLVRIKPLLIITATAVLFISFQNFTTISAEQLRPEFQSARVSSPTDGTGDIRLIAPYRAQAPDDPMLASPGSGRDLNTVGQDWASRQAKIITGGADERFLNDLNKRLNRLISSDGDDDVIDTGDGVAVAGAGAKSRVVDTSQDDDFFGLKPKSFRMLSLNRMSMGLSNNKTQISCQFQGQSMQWDLIHPIAKGFDINLRHETSISKSSVLINYSW